MILFLIKCFVILIVYFILSISVIVSVAIGVQFVIKALIKEGKDAQTLSDEQVRRGGKNDTESNESAEV